MSFKFLFKEDPLIWSHSWCINHAHDGQRKLVRTLTPELFCLHRFEGVRQEILLYCFPLGGGLVVSDLPLFFFPVTAAACHLFPIAKDGPLLYVTGTVRALFQLSLDVPFLPPLASQRLVRVRKNSLGESGKVEASSPPRVSEELCLRHNVSKLSVNESRNTSWERVHVSSHPGKKVKRLWPSYTILVLASVNPQGSVNVKSKHRVPW